MELSNSLDLFISAILTLVFTNFIVAKVFDERLNNNKIYIALGGDNLSIVEYDKAMTTKVLNSLKDKEFVSNNIKNIVLTEKGILVTDKVINELNLLKSEILGKVSEREISKFYKKLNQFNEILEGIC